MNLQAVAAPIIAAVNPGVTAQLRVSTGATTNVDGTQAPTYANFFGVPVQLQALTASEIAHLDGLNIQGVERSAYLNGNVEGLDRPAGKGGDILIIGCDIYLVVHVMETWDTGGWCKVGLRKQVCVPGQVS